MKAEADYNSALLLWRARKTPDYDGACFHAQQCAEKYVKARLQEAGITFPKTHDLTVLLTVCDSMHRRCGDVCLFCP